MATPLPKVQIRQPTQDSPQVAYGPNAGYMANGEELDHLTPLAASPSTAPGENESVVQPGVQLPNALQDIEGEITVCPGQRPYQGGFADVVKGEWKRPDGVVVPVAIKSLRFVSTVADPKSVRDRNELRIKREAIIWQRVTHGNILELYGFRSGDDTGSPQLISPWCEEGNLKDYLKRKPDLTPNEKLRLLMQAGHGLQHLHGCNPPIAHGDIKPENVLIKDDSSAALCDFGLARTLQTMHSGLTTSSQGGGSKGFQAWEILEGQRPTQASDVYAFGGLILNVLSGSPPFYGIKAIAAMIKKVEGGELPLFKEHPKLPATNPMWDILKRCWAKEPKHRPTLQEIVDQLEAAMHYQSETWVETPLAETPPPVLTPAQDNLPGAELSTMDGTEDAKPTSGPGRKPSFLRRVLKTLNPRRWFEKLRARHQNSVG